MINSTNGTAIVLYTFIKENEDQEIYNQKVKRLKELLPDEIQDLEDQSTILLLSNFDLEELERKLKEEYNGKLKQHESVILIFVEKDNVLKCIFIQYDNPQNENFENLINSFAQETDVKKMSKLAKEIVHSMHNYTKQTFRKILDNN